MAGECRRRGVAWPILPTSLTPTPPRDHSRQGVADTGQAGCLVVLCVTVSRAEAVVLPGPPQRVLSGHLTLWWGIAHFLEKGPGGFICKLLYTGAYARMYTYVRMPVFTYTTFPPSPAACPGTRPEWHLEEGRGEDLVLLA